MVCLRVRCVRGVIVGVEPGGVGVAAFLFGAVGLCVGPFVEQGAVEAFDLPVGLGSVGPGALVGDPGPGQRVAPGVGLVAGAVVGQHPLDGDPGGLEEGLGAGPEGGGGLLALVGQDLAVGQAGVVVDGVVQVAVAGPGAGPAAGLASQGLVAAAVGDVSQLLDVDVHQVAGGGVLVAADRAAGGAVQVGQAGEPVAGQDPVHGGRVEPQQVGDPGRSPAAQDADLDDPALGAGRGPVRAVVRTAGAVGHPRFAEFAVAVRPALGRGRRDLEPFCRAPQWPAVVDDASGQAQAAGLGQRCVTVWHEGLSGAGVDVAIHTQPEGPHSFQDHHAVNPVTNLHGQNS